MGCMFQSKLVSQKQPLKAFHKISIFQITDNSQGFIWDSSKILKKTVKIIMKKEEKKNHQKGSPPQGFSENHVKISEYLFTKHFRLATSDALVL